MIAEMVFKGQKVKVDLANGLNITLPVKHLQNGVNAYGLTEPEFKPFRFGNLVGSVAEGGSVNCEDILFNPHGNGTHTECYGHISKERVHVIEKVREHHFWSQLISVTPVAEADDLVITKESLAAITIEKDVKTLVIRTLPNAPSKMNAKYLDTNPPYFSKSAMEWIVEKGITNLLVDLPSVDKEKDAGLLETHHIYWNYPDNPRQEATITELIYVPEKIVDGIYLLNMQISSFESDASPSTIILYPLKK